MFNFSKKLKLYPEKITSALNDKVADSLSTVFLDLSTNICNFDCYFCDSKFIPKPKQQFSTERLLQIADELHQLKVNSVLLCADGGEPFLHIGIVSLVKKLHDYDIHVGIYTNGSILRDDIKEIFPMFDFIRVSLNASNNYTHRLIHRYKQVECWEKVKEFIQNALIYNKNVGASFLILKENYKEMYSAALLCKKLGMSYIEFKPAYTINYKIDSFMYCDAIRRSIMNGYNQSISLQSDIFRIILNNQLNDYIEGSTDITISSSSCKCVTSHLRLVISPSGCYLCTPYRGQLEYSIGNPQVMSIQEIWYSLEHEKLWNYECVYKCSYHEQNQILLKLHQEKSSFFHVENSINDKEENSITQKSFL